MRHLRRRLSMWRWFLAGLVDLLAGPHKACAVVLWHRAFHVLRVLIDDRAGMIRVLHHQLHLHQPYCASADVIHSRVLATRMIYIWRTVEGKTCPSCSFCQQELLACLREFVVQLLVSLSPLALRFAYLCPPILELCMFIRLKLSPIQYHHQ